MLHYNKTSARKLEIQVSDHISLDASTEWLEKVNVFING